MQFTGRRKREKVPLKRKEKARTPLQGDIAVPAISQLRIQPCHDACPPTNPSEHQAVPSLTHRDTPILPKAHLPHSPLPAFPWSRDPATHPSSCLPPLFLPCLCQMAADADGPHLCCPPSCAEGWGPCRPCCALLQTCPGM